MYNIEKLQIEKGEKCWENIGSAGTGICELLDEYNHCKNCPIYAQGGRRLFEREVSHDMISEWTSIISSPKEIEASNKISIVIFRIADEFIGINTNIFQEAIVDKVVHYVPFRTNHYFHGLINVNGELLMCVSLASFFNLATVNYENNSSRNKLFKNLLIIKDKYLRFAFPVDEFFGVFSVSKDIFKSPPLMITKADFSSSDSIIEIKNKKIAIINEKKLFSIIDKKLVW